MPVNSDRLKRHVVWVCAGCDECEPLDGAPPSRFPCKDSSSMNGALVVLAEEHEAEVERLREALHLIRMRYFPIDDAARLAWAEDTFRIARDALALDEEQAGGCWECGTSDKRGEACAEHQEARDAVYRERDQVASREEDKDG